jgi:RimJ/RimL family protein N-acetyltransferase
VLGKHVGWSRLVIDKLPYRAQQETTEHRSTTIQRPSDAVSADWRLGLPVLRGSQVTLRDLRPSDAPSLFAMLTTGEVARFISPPPTTIEAFERFIAWAVRQRLAGTCICFAVTLAGTDTAIGIFQLRELGQDFRTVEWGFAIGSPYWGTGVFQNGAELLTNFAFGVVGVHRLEARAAMKNGRGNGALRKLGAVQEGVLRKSFLKNGEYLDQVLWTILAEEWRQTPSSAGARIH